MDTLPPAIKVVISFLAIIGLLVVVAALGMWGMHHTMMGQIGGEGLFGKMFATCGMR